MKVAYKIKVGYPKLKRIIKQNNLTNQITNLINTDEVRLNAILNGENNDDFTHIEAIKICKFLGICPDDYFFS